MQTNQTKLTDHVTSLELAKELRENGYEQESIFYWIEAPHGWEITQKVNQGWFRSMESNDEGQIGERTKLFAAPLASEIAEKLPHGEMSGVEFTAQDEYNAFAYRVSSRFMQSFKDQKDAKLVDALAKEWLYLKSKGLL